VSIDLWRLVLAQLTAAVIDALLLAPVDFDRGAQPLAARAVFSNNSL
jgi:hypothetical protein